jgi:hypothetical protein
MKYNPSKIEKKDNDFSYENKIVLYETDKIMFQLSFFLMLDRPESLFTDDKIENVICVIKDNIHREFFIIDNAEPILPYLQNIKKFLDICKSYKKSVTIITGQNSNSMIDLYKSMELNVIFLPLFNLMSYSKQDTYSPFYKENTLEKKYLTLNRAYKKHRESLYQYLKDNDLLKFGEYSFGWKNISSFDENIDKSERQNYMVSIVDKLSFNQKCFLNFVIETENEDYYILEDKKIIPNFVSEKTYKMLLTGLPFIILGEPNLLENLKSYGIKTFSDYWDESYDLSPNRNNRFEKASSVLQDICYTSDNRLREIYNDTESIHKYNVELIDDILNNNIKILKEKINL